MHLARRGYLFIVLTALLGVAGTWSDDPAFFGRVAVPGLPACWPVSRSRPGTSTAPGWRVRMQVDSRLKLGRAAGGAFAFEHNRGRDLTLQYARVLPPALRQTTDVREVVLPPEDELRDPIALLPLRLGAGSFAAVPARVVRPVFRWPGGRKHCRRLAGSPWRRTACQVAPAPWPANPLARHPAACPVAASSCCSCAIT